jgi:predicted lactoylglutathione lyase
MKIKSVSGICCYVKDLQKSAAFYTLLGFEIRKKEESQITIYSNWFWIELKKKEKSENPVKGILIYLSVEDVDEFYSYLLKKGIKPVSEPQNRGINRELVIADPDGYLLVIFKRK